MSDQNVKCVMIIDEELPVGILANTAAILGVTLGQKVPECVGVDTEDASRCIHKGIITIPVPILKGNKEILRILRTELYTPEFSDLLVVDFSDVAQSCNIYSDYIKKVQITKEKEHTYLGIALYGSKKKVNKLTGSMPLLR
jgi:hypothetical protein